jgi:hypothetical protein
VGSESEGRISRYAFVKQDIYEYSHLAETKVLKQLVRDHIDPNRDLGHSDKHGKKKEEKAETESQDQTQVQQTQESTGEAKEVKRNPDGTLCEDCN